MATVKRGQLRIAPKHFGLYRTSAGGDEQLIVRRKVGTPVDYMHLNSRLVRDQRRRLSLASIHYSHLKPSQKAFWRTQMRYVERVGSPSREVLLKGRQLFISEDIHQLTTTQTELKIAFDICIILCNKYYEPLSGQLHLVYTEEGDEKEAPGTEVSMGNWLFPNVPAGCYPYRVEGEAEGYYDPKLPENQVMTEYALKNKHWHVLLVSEEEEDVFPKVPEGEVPCCTGAVERRVGSSGESWGLLWGGDGTGGGSPTYYPRVNLVSGRSTDKWRTIRRTIVCIETYDIPPSWNITQAWLMIYAEYKTNNFSHNNFGLSLCMAYPSDPHAMVKEDYNRFGDSLCSDHVIGYNAFEVGNWYSFPLNEWGIQCIHRHGVTCFGIREFFGDQSNWTPPWEYQKGVMMGYVGDTTADPHWPKLYVVHT
jgi:hypothetical protein